MKNKYLQGGEYLLYAFLALLFVLFTRTFWPTNAPFARFHFFLFSALAAISLFLFLWSGSVSLLRELPIILKYPLAAAAAAPLAITLLRIHAFSFGVLAILSFYGTACLAASETAILLFMLLRRTRGKTVRVAFSLILFLNCFLIIPSGIYLWNTPSEKECAVVDPGGAVKRITSHSLVAAHSTPYDVIYLPEKNIVAAGFKMQGNLMLGFWDKPGANILAAIDVSGPEAKPAVLLPFKEPLLAECMAWSPVAETLFMTRVGSDYHAITAVDFSGFPDLKKKWDMPLRFEPNGLALSADFRRLTVSGIEGAVAVFDAETKEEIAPAMQIPLSAGINAIDTYQASGSAYIYMAMVGKKITEINIETGGVQYIDVPFGGGQIAVDPAGGTLYQTDIMFNALNVIDLETMSLKKRLKLGFKPRAVQVDNRRGLLMIGDWLRGEIHFYNLSSLEKLRAPLPVAGYIRNFAYDHKRGRLYCATFCGVYEVDVEKIFSENGITADR